MKYSEALTEPKKMRYRIIRDDGEVDEITTQSFDNYDEAYNLLDKTYGDLCCSDADYEDRPYYEIILNQ